MYKNNRLVYFLGYLVFGLISISSLEYINLYNYIDVPDFEIFFFFDVIYPSIIVVSLLMKPLVAYLSDNQLIPTKVLKGRRGIFRLGSLGVIGFFALMVCSTRSFGLFVFSWSFLHVFLSITLVAIDGSIIDSASSYSDRASLISISLSGTAIGVYLYYFIDFIIYWSQLLRFQKFNLLLLSHLIFIVLFLIMSFLMFKKEDHVLFKEKYSIQGERFEWNQTLNSFLLMALFLTMFSFKEPIIEFTSVYDLIIFPYDFRELNILLIPSFNIIGYAIGYIIVSKIEPRKMINVLVPIFGMFIVFLVISLGLESAILYLALHQIVAFLEGLILVMLINYMMIFSEDNKSYRFQILNIIAPLVLLFFSDFTVMIFDPFESFLIYSLIFGITIALSVLSLKYIKVESIFFNNCPNCGRLISRRSPNCKACGTQTKS